MEMSIFFRWPPLRHRGRVGAKWIILTTIYTTWPNQRLNPLQRSAVLLPCIKDECQPSGSCDILTFVLAAILCMGKPVWLWHSFFNSFLWQVKSSYMYLLTKSICWWPVRSTWGRWKLLKHETCWEWLHIHSSKIKNFGTQILQLYYKI